MKENLKKKVTSIRTHIILVIVFVCAVTIMASLFMNSVFLKKVYLKDRMDGMLSAFNSIYEAGLDQSLYDQDFASELEGVSLRYNVDIIVSSPNGAVLITTKSEGGQLLSRMMKRMYSMLFSGKDEEKKQILYSEDNLSIEQFHDSEMKSDFLILWGTLFDGNILFMQSGIEPMETSANIANRLVLITGIISIFIGLIVAYMLGRRLTKPIMELSDLSKKMASLDFDARYVTRDVPNEIDILGYNMNVMSEKLEDTILELKKANIDLQNDVEKLNETDRKRREFLSAVSHELKTPLFLIQGYAEGLSDGISDDPEDWKFYSDVIKDEAGKMNVLVNDLLSLDRLEEGKTDFIIERFDIVPVINSLIEKNRKPLSDGGIKVDFDGETPFYVISDEFYTGLMIENYFSNAIHHVKGDEKIITISLKKTEDKKARVSVKNTGDNIPEEALQHLFEKFYKMDKSRSREYGGSGIGLSLVKTLSEKLGAGCGVNNLPDGVEFYFDLDF